MNGWTKTQLLTEFARSIHEYESEANELRVDDPKYAFLLGQAQAIYDLALRFDIWAFDLQPYVDMVREEKENKQS